MPCSRLCAHKPSLLGQHRPEARLCKWLRRRPRSVLAVFFYLPSGSAYRQTIKLTDPIIIPHTQSIGKAELVDTLKEKTGLAKKDIDEVISAFASAVREEVLVGGKEIRLRDFGTFKRKVTAARVGRNPRTGEELQISGAKSVSFSVSSSLKVKDAPAPAKKAKK